MKKILLLVLGIFILSVCFAGCTQPSSPIPVPAQTPTVSQPVATQPVATQYIATQPVVTQSPIVGTWDLLSYQNGKAANQTVITGSVPTAIFGPDNKLSGSGGCNRYAAEYKTTASNGITITQPINTLMACPEPVMQQETQYLSLLQQATRYNISGDQLALFDKNGVQVLTYKKQVSMPSTVVGTWNLFSYNNGKDAIQTTIPGSITTAVFGSDLNLSGSGGCNRYFAQYATTASNGITITQPASTMMACAEDLMQQETQYLSLLPTAAKFELSGDQLTLFNSKGTKILTYKKQVSMPSTVVGTWNLFSFNNGKDAIQTTISGSITTAVFGSDLNLSGSGGCNRYFAQYATTASNGITITQPGSTMMACAEDLMQQETQYLSLLPTAAKFELSGDQLTLFNSKGTRILIYKSAGLKVNPLG